MHRALLDEAGEINPFPTLMPIQAEKAPKGGRAPVPLTPETKTKIVTLRAEGASLREIQAATGVRRSTLGRRLNAGLASAPEPPPPDPALSGALARVAAASKRIEEGETKLREGERMITDAHAQIQATHLAMAQLWVPKGTQGTRSLAPLASPPPTGGSHPTPAHPNVAMLRHLATLKATGKRLVDGQIKQREGQRLLVEAHAALQAAHAEVGDILGSTSTDVTRLDVRRPIP